MREERRPLLVEAVTYRFRGHSMADPEQYRSKEEVAQWRERDPIPAFAERLIAEGLIDEAERERIDAEALARVDAAVAFAESLAVPGAESLYDDVYVLDGEAAGTRCRPRGSPPGAGSPLPTRSPSRSRAPQAADALRCLQMRYREALNAALREELARDERVLLMGEDIGVFGGAFKVTDGLLEEFGERRVRDTPISENTIVGVGVGAAMTGLRPVVELMTINFSLLAFDQIVNHAAHIHYMFGGQARCRWSCACPRAPATSSGPPTRTAWRRCSCTFPACSSPCPPPPPTRRAC